METELNQKLTEAAVVQLVEEHLGWATSIAKSVARAWNLDWQLDGLDGGAYEGLLFCAKRYDPDRGVPFKAYARRRIHEAATEEARKSKRWQQGVGSGSEEESAARDISFTLMKIFPEIREGMLPEAEDENGDQVRSSIRQLLTGASLIAAFKQSTAHNPEAALEFRELITVARQLEPVHQAILHEIYWKGSSMRGLAMEWDIDELSIVREHKVIIDFIFRAVEGENPNRMKPLKVRRSLRLVAQQMKKKNEKPPLEAVLLTILIALIANITNTFSGIS